MRKTVVLILLLCLSLTQAVKAQTTAIADIKQLQKEMYRLFPTNEVDSFTQVVEQLKVLCQKSGDETLFYKAWCNLAIYSFSHVDRNKGLDILKEVRTYAEQHNSKYGLFASTLVSASQLSTLKLYDQAEKMYREAIDYQHRFFPEESAASAYLGLAKIYTNQGKVEQILDCADHALAEPGVIVIHRLAAKSYKCMAIYISDFPDKKERFNECYAQRETVKALKGSDDDFGQVVDYEYALINENYEQALAIAQEMRTKLDRLNKLPTVYALMNNYEQAYLTLKEYYTYRDSVNSEDLKKESSEHALQLSLVRAENEAKDLRLANQALQLAQVESQLQQQRLQAEATELTLKNREIELEKTAVQLEKATLDGQAREWQYRERLSKLEAERLSKQARETTERFVLAIIAVVLAALAYIVYRRIKQVRKLKAMNEELRTAYDQLEQTTSVKERIESELRIARNIQMSMVPGMFPDRPDLDVYAYMKPAKEVGGDLYGYVLIKDIFYFCVGDVSGKGIPASLFMAQSSRLFHALAVQHLMPTEMANTMNEELSENNEAGMFVTMFIGMVNLETGRLDYCNCGHNPPVLVNSFMEMESNAPIGLWPELEFVGEHIDNIRNQRLFVYTDGLNEAEDSWQNQFGDHAVLAMLQKHPDYSSRKTVDMFITDIAAHVGEADASDDLTMMCITIK